MRKLLPVVVSFSLATAACTTKPQPAPRTAASTERAMPPPPRDPKPAASQPTAAPASQKVSLFHGPAASDAGPAPQPDAGQPSLAEMMNPQTGVVECDEYLHKYITCVASKIPPDQQQLMARSLVQMVDAWRQAAATPAGRRGLAQACKTALATAKRSMKAFGCTW